MVRSGSWTNKLVRSTGVVAVVGSGVLSVAGCTTLKPRADFDSPLPQDRFLAVRQANATPDRAAVVDLIRQLSSDDVLVRLVAIDALASITGERLGFEADASAADRREAVARWVAWQERGGSASGLEDARDE